MHSPLASPKATIARLKELGLYTKKHLGQHFLIDDNVIGRILALADVQAGDTVIEVGPGIGTLTLALQAVGAHITAIEYDAALVEPLRDITDPAQVTVIEGDAARMGGQLLPSIAPPRPRGASAVGAAVRDNCHRLHIFYGTINKSWYFHGDLQTEN